jgi:hypothetical protein
MRDTAVMVAPEKFVIQTPAELSEGIEQLAEAKLAEDGLRRVSEWEWRDHTEAAEEFEARVAFLQSKIGQPRFLGNPDPDDGSVITTEEVEQARAAGPRRHRVGSCWVDGDTMAALRQRMHSLSRPEQ